MLGEDKGGAEEDRKSLQIPMDEDGRRLKKSQAARKARRCSRKTSLGRHRGCWGGGQRRRGKMEKAYKYRWKKMDKDGKVPDRPEGPPLQQGSISEDVGGAYSCRNIARTAVRCCNCSAATAMLQEHRTCSSAAAAQLQRCRCSVAGAALQQRNSNAPAAATLQQQLCNRVLQQQRSCSCSCGAATSTLEPHRTLEWGAYAAPRLS
eukprot:gene15811-biopygen3267